jgi:hypothetical protein
MEAIAAEDGVRPCNEPLNIRKPEVRARLRIDDWTSLVSGESLPRIERYFRALLRGGIGYSFKTPRPLQKNYHFLTDRVVLKVLFGCEDRISWLKRTFDAQVVCLVRHPIPVSISREVLPRLPALLGSEYARTLSPSQRDAAFAIFEEGSHLEKAQLDWCLQNKPLLDQFNEIDLFVTYEQLVIQPDVVVDALADTLGLRRRDEVRASLDRLSGSVSKSSDSSLKILDERKQNQLAVIAKWRRSVSAGDECRLMNVLASLDMDIYRAQSLLPSQRYWIGDSYPAESQSPADANALHTSAS